MDKSVKNKKPKSDLRYSSDSFFYSISESLMEGKIFVTVTIIIASLIYFHQFELWSTKDECKKYKDYWYEPITRTYKLEHKLQEGNNLWFFMKDTKTGKDVDLNDIAPKLFVSKNEGDIVSITNKRYKVYPEQYDKSIWPTYNKFSWPWWWLFWFPILCIGILFMFSEESGSFNYYGDYYLENKLGRKPTELEIKLNKLLMGIWEIFVWSAPIISLISTLIFLIIYN